MNEFLKYFEESGALLSGHFLLTSGLHSDKYFQCALVLQYPEYAEKLCSAIAKNFKNTEIDTVVSPAIGGIVVGQEVGRLLNKKTIFTERVNGEMKLRRGFTVNKGEKFLVCEDVVTTGGSVFEVIDLISSAGGVVTGVGFIVDRSNGKADFGFPQFSCLQMRVNAYKEADCPLCHSGSKPVKPGSRNN